MSTNSKKVKTVLFVCVENACRSQLAEAISNHFYPDRLHAFSAGSKPSTKINPKAIHSLKDLGIVHKGKTKSISQAEGINYDYIVGMGCGDACPTVPGAKRLEWSIPDPKSFGPEKFNKIRDKIKEKIESDLL